jgi:acetyl-CoA carboxylase biotin carboxyl carrier protein
MAGKQGKAAKPSQNGNGDVLSKLKGLYEFMTSNNLETIEIDEADLHLRMVRRKANPPQQVPVPVMMQAGAAHAAPAASQAAPAAAPAPAGQTIKAPMMGIFYRAPSPSSPPFVKDGEKVKPGQLICMIEAMKVFNEIKAEFPFTVTKTLLENGKPVKSGQDIFLVERA